MIYNRYPDSGHIEYAPAATGGSTSGILGEDLTVQDTIPITGRLERKSVTDGTYKAIFYTGIIPGLSWSDFPNARLHLNGRVWNIVDVVPFQTHTEIWVS